MSGRPRRGPDGEATRPPRTPRPVFAAAAAVGLVAAGAGCSEPEPVELATVLPPAAEAPAGPADPGPGATETPTDTVCVDTARSLVRWKGTEVTGDGHAGVVGFAGGRLRLRDDRVTGGAVTVDMRTIAITDIPADQVEARRQLRSHLAHEEFFAVERFPTARLVLTAVEGGEHGLYRVAGNLAIRDSVHNVAFEVTAPVVTAETVWATADFGIDRRLWGVEFDGRTSALRNALVHDAIQLEITLVATRAACRMAAERPGDAGR